MAANASSRMSTGKLSGVRVDGADTCLAQAKQCSKVLQRYLQFSAPLPFDPALRRLAARGNDACRVAFGQLNRRDLECLKKACVFTDTPPDSGSMEASASAKVVADGVGKVADPAEVVEGNIGSPAATITIKRRGQAIAAQNVGGGDHARIRQICLQCGGLACGRRPQRLQSRHAGGW